MTDRCRESSPDNSAVVSASPRATTRVRCDHLLAALSGEVKARLCKTTADADSVKRIAARVAPAPGAMCSDKTRALRSATSTGSTVPDPGRQQRSTWVRCSDPDTEPRRWSAPGRWGSRPRRASPAETKVFLFLLVEPRILRVPHRPRREDVVGHPLDVVVVHEERRLLVEGIVGIVFDRTASARLYALTRAAGARVVLPFLKRASTCLLQNPV